MSVGVRRVLTENLVLNSLRCLPQLRLIYFTNHKAASTTIMYHMLAAARTPSDSKKIIPHQRKGEGTLFVENIFKHSLFGSAELRGFTSFSVVRNPFTRALSGYLHKIRGDSLTWRGFASQIGVREDVSGASLSFIDFLRIIDNLPDELINNHFRPQYMNLLLPFSAPHFVGRLERFNSVARFLERVTGAPVVSQQEQATDSESYLEKYYTPEAEAIVARKFAADFELFGYSPKLAEVEALHEPQWKAGGPDHLMDWLAGGTFPAAQLDSAPRIHLEITTGRGDREKIKKIREIYQSEDNCKRLESYARVAKRTEGAKKLHARIEMRIATLRNALRASVKDKEVFIPPAPEERADETINKIRETWKSESDWQRLESYARIAGQARCETLQARIEKRIAALRNDLDAPAVEPGSDEQAAETIGKIRETWKSEDDRQRLESYARIAGQARCATLQARIEKRIAALRNDLDAAAVGPGPDGQAAETIGKIRETWKSEDDRQRLENYARIAGHAGCEKLQTRIEERIAALRNTVHVSGEDSDTVAPLESGTAKKKPGKERKKGRRKRNNKPPALDEAAGEEV